MDRHTRERDLLFGTLALRAGAIGPDDLIRALKSMDDWSDAPTTLADMLVEQGHMDSTVRDRIEPLVERHIALHGGDASKALDDAETVLAGADGADGDGAQVVFGPDATTITPLADPEATAPYDTGTTREHAGPGRGGADGQPGTGAFDRRYEILRHHASGGLGEVYVALDKELGREVALKTVRRALARHAIVRERFVLEAEIAGNLEHPNIVPVHSLGGAPGGPFYAMRFVQGETLKAAIAAFHRQAATLSSGERSLRLRDLLGRFVAVCEAITYAHARGVLHRDLKPSNILVGKYGETLLIDWGMAKATERSDPRFDFGTEGPFSPPSGTEHDPTLAGSALGTPQFMSPEQAEGRVDDLDPRTDVYGLGGILYAILTNRPPIEGDRDVKVTLGRVLRGEVRRPRLLEPRTPRPLEAICLKALAPGRDDRYGTARELADDVRCWLADEPVGAYAEPWPERAARRARRHRTAATSVAVALVAAVIGLTAIDVLVSREKARVEAAKKEADENFRDARGAVRQMLTKLAAADLPAVPQSEGLRVELAEAADGFSRNFVSRRPHDPEVRADSAAIDRELGNLYRMVHRLDSAEAAYKRATATLAALDRSDRRDGRHANLLALTLIDHAELERLRGRPDLAVSDYQAALATLEALPEDRNRRFDPGRTRAWARANLAGARLDAGQVKEALDDADAAAADIRGLRGFPAGLMEHLLMAMVHQVRAEARRQVGRPLDEVLRSFDLSLQVIEPKTLLRVAQGGEGPRGLAALAPNFDYVRASAQIGRGRALAVHPERRADAERVLSEAVAGFSRLRDDFPGVMAYRRGLPTALVALGAVRRGLGRLGPAREDLRRARDETKSLADAFPKSVILRVDHALALAELGRLELADNRAADAIPLLERAAALLEAEAPDAPANPLVREERARVREDLEKALKGR